MPLICYGCGKVFVRELDKCCDNCVYFTKEFAVGYAECLHKEMTEEIEEKILQDESLCPFYKEGTFEDVCNECAKQEEGGF